MNTKRGLIEHPKSSGDETGSINITASFVGGTGDETQEHAIYGKDTSVKIANDGTIIPS